MPGRAKASVNAGHVFRPVNRGDRVVGDAISEKIVWQLLRSYAAAAGWPVSRPMI